MKKYVDLIFLLFIIVICLFRVEVFASSRTLIRDSDNNYLINKDIDIDSNLDDIINTPAVDVNELVYDFADLFSDSEEDEILFEVREFIDTYNMDLAIVTTDNNLKESTRDYAEDFYKYNDFGINHDGGIIFVIDMSKREFYMLTADRAKTYFPDSRVDDCLDLAFPFIKQGSYAEGVISFVNRAYSFMLMGEVNSFTDTNRYDNISDSVVNSFPWGKIACFSLVVTVIIMIVLISNNKMVREAYSSRDYLTDSSAKVVSDVFLGRHVSKTRRPKNDDNNHSSHGGFSSSSGGGGGSSFGGGGRSF